MAKDNTPMRGKCECGHESCFHQKSSMTFFSNKGACSTKGCECLRFTPIETVAPTVR